MTALVLLLLSSLAGLASGACPETGYGIFVSAADLPGLQSALAAHNSVCIEITANIPVTSTIVVSAGQTVLLYSEAMAVLDGQGTTQILSSTGALTVQGLAFERGYTETGGAAISVSGGSLSVIGTNFTGSYSHYSDGGGSGGANKGGYSSDYSSGDSGREDTGRDDLVGGGAIISRGR